jgi:hypothetical protein
VRRYGEAVGVPPQPRAVGRRWVGSEGYLAQEEDKETAGESDSKAAVGGNGRTQRPRGIRATGHALGRPFPKLNLCDAVNFCPVSPLNTRRDGYYQFWHCK